MSMEGQEEGSWSLATVDTVLSILALLVIWYPVIYYTNTVAGFPLIESSVNFAVAVLAFGSSYPFVAGHLSLGDLGEYLFLLLASALVWGIIGTIATVAAGMTFSGSNYTPLAATWGLAYLTAYSIVFRTKITIFN
jgi:hypothetical protein